MLDTGCQHGQKCKIDCNKLMESKFGICSSSTPSHFLKIEDSEEFKDVCLFKSYTDDDDAHFAKLIIERDLGIHYEIENSLLFKEFQFQVKIKRMSSYCQKNPDAYETELADLQRDQNSPERMARLSNITALNQTATLTRILFFARGKFCDCLNFENFWEDSGILFQEKKDEIIAFCEEKYPECYEELPGKEKHSPHEYEMKERIVLDLTQKLAIVNKRFQMEEEVKKSQKSDRRYHALRVINKLAACEESTCSATMVSKLERLRERFEHFDEEEEEEEEEHDKTSEIELQEALKFYLHEFDMSKVLTKRWPMACKKGNVTAYLCKVATNKFMRNEKHRREFPLFAVKRTCQYRTNKNNCRQKFCYETATKEEFNGIATDYYKANVEVNTKQICAKTGVYDTKTLFIENCYITRRLNLRKKCSEEISVVTTVFKNPDEQGDKRFYDRDTFVVPKILRCKEGLSNWNRTRKWSERGLPGIKTATVKLVNQTKKGDYYYYGYKWIKVDGEGEESLKKWKEWLLKKHKESVEWYTYEEPESREKAKLIAKNRGLWKLEQFWLILKDFVDQGGFQHKNETHGEEMQELATNYYDTESVTHMKKCGKFSRTLRHIIYKVISFSGRFMLTGEYKKIRAKCLQIGRTPAFVKGFHDFLKHLDDLRLKYYGVRWTEAEKIEKTIMWANVMIGHNFPPELVNEETENENSLSYEPNEESRETVLDSTENTADQKQKIELVREIIKLMTEKIDAFEKKYEELEAIERKKF